MLIGGNNSCLFCFLSFKIEQKEKTKKNISKQQSMCLCEMHISHMDKVSPQVQFVYCDCQPSTKESWTIFFYQFLFSLSLSLHTSFVVVVVAAMNLPYVLCLNTNMTWTIKSCQNIRKSRNFKKRKKMFPHFRQKPIKYQMIKKNSNQDIF